MLMIRPFIVFIFIILALAGCGGGPSGTTETSVPDGGTTPTSAAEPSDYPEPQEDVYPEPETQQEGYPDPESANPESSINQPVTVSDVQVTGTGLAVVSIDPVNLTSGG